MKQKNITDAQVLAQLKSRKVRLQIELERVNIAIKAFERVKEIDPLDAIVYEIDELQDSTGIQNDLAVAILMYNPAMTAEKKILYALDNIKSGTAEDISDYIIRVDGHIKNTNKVYNRITYVASRMYKAGRLEVEKQGNKNIYKKNG